MLVHVLFILLVWFGTSLDSRKQKRFVVFLGFILFVIFAFRDYQVGNDYFAYIDEFNSASKISKVDYTSEFEPGRRLLNEFCRTIGLSSRGYTILLGMITCVPLVMFIKRYSVLPCLTLLLYITIGNYSFNFTGVRQTIAISIILFGLFFSLKEKSIVIKILILVISILIARTMHNTANICFLFLPMLFIRRVSQRMVMLISFLPVIIIFLSSLVMDYIRLFAVVKYENYLENDYSPNIIAYFVIPYLIYLYSALLYLIWLSKNKEMNDHFNLPTFLYLSTAIYAMIAGASLTLGIVSRLSFYFNLLTYILISNMLHDCINKQIYKKLLMVGMIVLCVAFFMISAPGGTLGIDNYTFSIE